MTIIRTVCMCPHRVLSDQGKNDQRSVNNQPFGPPKAVTYSDVSAVCDSEVRKRDSKGTNVRYASLSLLSQTVQHYQYDCCSALRADLSPSKTK